MDDSKKFFAESRKNIKLMNKDDNLKKLSWKWFVKTFKYKYPYNFTWLGLPVIQYPHDLVLLQEIIWNLKPRIIVETGVARGGSLIFYASMINLLNNKGKVIGIDIDIRKHNKNNIKKHPMFKNIDLIQGSSIEKKVLEKVKKKINNKKPVMIILDSNHTHNHVLSELNLYSELITKESFFVVFDTHCEFLPKKLIPNRPWGKGNSGYTAVKEFLKKNKKFRNVNYEDKTLVSCAPFGFLKKIS